MNQKPSSNPKLDTQVFSRQEVEHLLEQGHELTNDLAEDSAHQPNDLAEFFEDHEMDNSLVNPDLKKIPYEQVEPEMHMRFNPDLYEAAKKVHKKQIKQEGQTQEGLDNANQTAEYPAVGGQVRYVSNPGVQAPNNPGILIPEGGKDPGPAPEGLLERPKNKRSGTEIPEPGEDPGDLPEGFLGR